MMLQHCLHITKPYLMQIPKIPLCTVMRVTRGATHSTHQAPKLIAHKQI